MLLRQPRSTLTDTLFPYPPLFRSLLGHAALLLQAVRALLGAALPVAALVAVAFGALAFFVDAAPLLLAAQAVLLVDALACTALVVAAVVDAVALQVAADHARGAVAVFVVATVVGAVALQVAANHARGLAFRSEEHTSELQSLLRIS